MTEKVMGEFERRIQEIFGISWESDGYRDIIKVLEDARKDFPKFMWVKRGEPNLQELRDWFFKWFGGKKET